MTIATATAPATFAEFESCSRAEGFDEILERRWAPGTRLETHSHPFAVKAIVVEGDFVLTVDGVERRLQAGDRFELGRDVPHAELYGSAGAVFWAARRHARG